MGDQLRLVAHRHVHLDRIDQVAGEGAGQAFVGQRLALDGVAYPLAFVGVGLGLCRLVEQGIERDIQRLGDVGQGRDRYTGEVALRLGEEARGETGFAGDLVQGLLGGAAIATQAFADAVYGHWGDSC